VERDYEGREKLTRDRKLLYDRSVVSLAVETMVEAIIMDFRQRDLRHVGLMGIQIKGYQLAQRIRQQILKKTGILMEIGALDISMYRDDIGMRQTLPEIHPTDIPYDVNGKAVILVDDVLQTGRSIRAALDAITDYGRPSMIRLAVMIDRSGREYPIRADYTGLNIEVEPTRSIKIEFGEDAADDAIYEVKQKNIPIK